LNSEVNRLANALIALGVEKGDRVGLMLPNLPQALIGYYGILRAGAIVVEISPLYVERELKHLIADSGAQVIIALDIFYPRIVAVINGVHLKAIILTGVRDYLPRILKLLYPIKAKMEGQWIKVKKTRPVYDLKDLIIRSRGDDLCIDVSPDDTALLQYTGGTTGIPKGVVLTHRNLMVNLLQCACWMPSLKKGEEVFLGVIPFFHVYGMTACMNFCIYLASTIVVLPKFKVEEVLKSIARYKTSVFMGVQAMYVAINNYEKVKNYSLSSIKVCISGAGPLHAEVQERFEGLTRGKLVEGYGLTEASPVTHCNPIFGMRKKGSIGLPFPDTDARIVDPVDGKKDMPAGEIGELIVKGPQVMKGYWMRTDETNAVLRDGWLYTGDLARMDEDGFFYIVERKKDMIKTGGENVYPREVEEALFRHPKIKDAVVVGIPDEFRGELIKAYIVLKDGESAAVEEITDFCKKEMAGFKVPRALEFRKELPKTLVGKVLRRVLLEEELEKMKRQG
ncbi:MAG: long-chain fatty acid--CoA ligase, partial [Nitrospirota bacterium]